MTDRYVTLLGAEQVQSAANTMSSAADRMQSAASSIDDAVRRHRDILDEWISRFELAAQATSPLAKPDVDVDFQIRLSELLDSIEALKGPYPAPAERGEYAAQTALFDLYQAADAVKRSSQS